MQKRHRGAEAQREAIVNAKKAQRGNGKERGNREEAIGNSETALSV